nr:NS2A protein [Kamiti River virus]
CSDFRSSNSRTGVGFDRSILNLLCLAVSLQLIGAKTRVSTLTRLVLTILAMLIFGMPNIFSSVGLSAWVLLAASSSLRPRDVLMNLWIILQTGSSAVLLLGFMIRKRMSIVLGTQHMVALVCVHFLFSVVDRHQKTLYGLLELSAAAILIGAYNGISQTLPPEVLVFCLVMGWKTSLAILTVVSLMFSLHACYRFVVKFHSTKNGYRDYGASSWFWIVSFASAGAIWAAERA